MKKWILTFIIVLISIVVKAQTITQTYIDPCDGKTYVTTFPFPNSVISVLIRNKVKTFTYEQAQSGEVQVWINAIFLEPCPVTQAATVTQTQVAASTASAAASAAAKAAATPPPTAPPPPPSPSPSSTSTPSSSSNTSTSNSSSSESSSSSNSSSTESKSESKSETSESKEESKSEESKSEESKEEKKEEKKENKQKQQRINPLLISSDLTTAQNPDNSFSAIMNVGISKNSMAGNESYGATAMVWSTLNQFALSTRYTKITYNSAQAVTVANTSLTTAYAQGNIFAFLGYSEVLSKPKMGVLGYNVNLGAMFFKNMQMYMNSLTIFYMRPSPVSKKLTLTPSIFANATPAMYSMKKFNVDPNFGFLIGSTFDYSITKRFKFGFDYKVSLGTLPETPILNFLMIGSKIQL